MRGSKLLFKSFKFTLQPNSKLQWSVCILMIYWADSLDFLTRIAWSAASDLPSMYGFKGYWSGHG